MRPAKRNIALVRGDDYRHMVTFTDEAGDPLDVSAKSYAAQVRAHPDDAAILADFTVDDAGAATGTIWLTIDAATTALLAVGRRAWDIQETDGDGFVTTLMGGAVDVLADVTRETP